MARWPLSALVFVAFAFPALAAEPRIAKLSVPGMNCHLCPVTVRKALERVPGVLEAKADFATKTAEAKYDPDKVSAQALAKAVGDAGYPAMLTD